MQLSLLDSLISDMSDKLGRDGFSLDVTLRPSTMHIRMWASLPWSPKFITIKTKILYIEELLEATDPSKFFCSVLADLSKDIENSFDLARLPEKPGEFAIVSESGTLATGHTLDSIRKEWAKIPMAARNGYTTLRGETPINPMTGVALAQEGTAQ